MLLIISRKQVTAFKHVPDLERRREYEPALGPGVSSPALISAYHTPDIPYVNLVRLRCFQDDFGRPVYIRLDVFRMYHVPWHGRPEIAEDREDNSQDRRRQPPHGVTVKERQDALPQRGVHKTAVASIRPGYLERVEELPDTAAAGMAFRCRPDSAVHGNLKVDLGTETLGVYKELQRDMASTAVSELAPVNISLGGGAGSSRAPRTDRGQ